MKIIDSKIQGNLLQEFTAKYLEEHKELVEHIRETTKKQLTLTDVRPTFFCEDETERQDKRCENECNYCKNHRN